MSFWDQQFAQQVEALRREMKHGFADLRALITDNNGALMSTLDDILAKQATALQKATENTNALGAIKTVLDANTATIADLKAQLDAAGTDPAKLQQLSDNMDQLLASQDTQAAAEAALANTPAASAPEPVQPAPEPVPPTPDAG